MKNILVISILFLSLQVSFGQEVLDQKEAERIYKESILEGKSSKAYFTEDEKCRKLFRARNYALAETSCRRSVSLAEKLPKSRYMEKHSAYKVLGVVLLWQRKAREAIQFLEKSLEIAKPNLDDTNAETGEVYFFLGQANHLLEKIEIAKGFYTKAESVYRFAFEGINADEIRFPYAKSITNILEAHLILLENAEMKDDAAQIEKRLTETKKEFAKYLKE